MAFINQHINPVELHFHLEIEDDWPPVSLEASSLDEACGIREFVAPMPRIPLHFIRARVS